MTEPHDEDADRPERIRARIHRLEEAVEQAAVEAELETGRQEETVEEAKDAIHVRLARMALGLILLVAGIVMLAIPGPGLVTIGVALAILARDFVWAERVLDRIRDRLPQDDEGELDPRVIVLSVVFFVAGVVAMIWWYVIR